jgi:hypothetical protein
MRSNKILDKNNAPRYILAERFNSSRISGEEGMDRRGREPYKEKEEDHGAREV